MVGRWCSNPKVDIDTLGSDERGNVTGYMPIDVQCTGQNNSTFGGLRKSRDSQILMTGQSQDDLTGKDYSWCVHAMCECAI